MIRRIIIPDSDAELTNLKVASGETLLITPNGPHDISTCQALVKQATGVQPKDSRCAVVDVTNTVIEIVQADSIVDTHPQGSLISCYSSDIKIGCTYNSITGLFSTPLVIIPIGTFVSSTKSLTTSVTTIPATVIPNLSVS